MEQNEAQFERYGLRNLVDILIDEITKAQQKQQEVIIIQRERHTNLPMIQSSGIKGKLRSAFENNGGQINPEIISAVFGSRETSPR